MLAPSAGRSPSPVPLGRPPGVLAGTLLLASSLACAHRSAPAVPLEPPLVERLEVGQAPAISLDHEGRPVIVSLLVPESGVGYPQPLALEVARRRADADAPPWRTDRIQLTAGDAPRWPPRAWIRQVEPDGAALLIDVQDDDLESPAPVLRWRLNAAGDIEARPVPPHRWTRDAAVVARWESQRDSNYVDPLAHRTLHVVPSLWLWDADWVDAGYPKRRQRWVEVPARLAGDHPMTRQCPVIPPPPAKAVVDSPFTAAYDDGTLWVVLGVEDLDCNDGPEPCVRRPPSGSPELMVGICRDWRWTLLPVAHEGHPVVARYTSAVLDARRRFHVVATEQPGSYGEAAYIRLDPPVPSPK